MIDLRATPLLTDLYQLAMLQAYYDRGMEETAVFEFFVRRLPPNRNFLVAAGLEQLLVFVEGIRFSSEELDWIRDSGHFSRDLADRLVDLRFTGAVHAMPEGTVFFENEPIVRVAAPMPQAQLIESRLINILHYQTLIASKAARVVLAAPEKLLVDFGMRRAHGAEAALFAARASYLAGFSGTATALAELEFGVPVFGTMAHSFVQAHAAEELAFEHFAASHPTNLTLLIDTYDTEAGARKVARLAPLLKQRGITVQAVRLDSGDLAAHARAVRRILDASGLTEVAIFASGNLDEYGLRALLRDGVPIDGFGLGTHLDISTDAPFLDCVYKLQEYALQARRKRSEGKATWPGRKQVYRSYDRAGVMVGDLLTVESDRQEGTPLILPVMMAGKRLAPADTLETIRQRVTRGVAQLPASLRTLDPVPPYPVAVSSALKELAAEVDQLTRTG
jgi:nicotinate phosphoribosyltransferase